MLLFQEQIILDLLKDLNGGLIILSSSLSLPSLVASLLHLHHPSQGSLLILSASDTQKSAIIRSFRRLHYADSTPSPNSNSDPPLPSDIPSDLPSHHRTAIYSFGAAFFVTPRILITDLLISRVPPSAVAGLLVLDAHCLSDTSTEAFIARILRSISRSASVHAFSDYPYAMVAGFAKAERTLKCLFFSFH